MKIKFLWKIMLPVWKKDKKIFTSLLVNLNKLFNNLHLLKDLEKKGYEVLYMVDPIDEYVIQ